MSELARNKKAFFEYTILSEWEGGLVLTGPEVKSVKKGQMSLQGAFVTIDRAGRVWLTNAHISPYAPAKMVQLNYDPERPRQLLLHKAEIAELRASLHERGLTLVPLSVYTKRRLLKVRLGLARGKHKADKRASIKARDIAREIRELRIMN